MFSTLPSSFFPLPSPEVLEGAYARSEYVEQSFVYGESTWRYTVALIVPRKSSVMEWVNATHPEWIETEHLEWEDIAKKPEVKEMILKDITHYAQDAHLQAFQIARNIAILPSPFGEEYVTPSLKLKRYLIMRNYKDILNECYSSVEH